MSATESAPAPEPAAAPAGPAPASTVEPAAEHAPAAPVPAPAPSPAVAPAQAPVPDPTPTDAPPSYSAPEPTAEPTPTTTEKPKEPESTMAADAVPEATAISAAVVPAPTPAPAPATPVAPSATADDTDAKEAKTKRAVEFVEGVEPQNALTERFTDAEWKALKEFRKLLPDILKAAYDEKPDAATTPIKLWGVTIDPADVARPQDARVSVILMKFLRARHLNPSAAKDMMVATLRWRDEFNIEKAMAEEFPDDVFGQLGHVYGKDKEGRPVVYNVYGGNQDLKAVFGDVQRFLRWRVKLMEETVALLDFETVDSTVQVHDYEGVSLSSRDANSKAAASEASSIFAAHYPELLHRKLFVNVPTLMTWIFWLFKPIIPANTLAKMSVVGSGPHTIGKEMLPLVDKSQLPKQYGGAADPGWVKK